MVKKINKKQLEKYFSVLWAHGDNVLSSAWGARVPYSKEDLRLLLNFHSLFAEKLCVVDASFLNNEPLRRLFMYDGYDVLLSKSIIVPMLRASVSDFESLEYQLRHMGRYGLLNETNARVYASFLDDKVPVVLPTEDKYFIDVLTQDYESGLLSSDFLTKVGPKIHKDLTEYIKKYQKKVGLDSIWRSMFFFFADDLSKSHPIYASRLKWLSSAIWNNVFLQAFNVKPAFPHTYSEAILPITAKDKEAAKLCIENEKGDFIENIKLTLDDIQHLNASDIINIRNTDQAKSYFTNAKQIDQEKDPLKARKMLLEAHNTYLTSLSDQLAAIGTGNYRKISSLHKKLHIVKWSRLGGGIGIALVNYAFVSDPVVSLSLLGAGIIWQLGGSTIDAQTLKGLEKENLLARKQWEDMRKSITEQRPIINVSETRKGLKPPLF